MNRNTGIFPFCVNNKSRRLVRRYECFIPPQESVALSFLYFVLLIHTTPDQSARYVMSLAIRRRQLDYLHQPFS